MMDPLLPALPVAFGLGGVAAFLWAARRRRVAVSRLRAWCEDGARDDPPRLPPAFRPFAAACHALVDDLSRCSQAATREARLARMRCRSLERERGAFERVLESLADAVCVVEPGGGVRWTNGAARALLGWTDADAQGGPSIFEALSALDAELEEALRDALGSEGRAAPREVDASDETRRLVLRASFHAVRGADGEFDGVALVLRDVTREVELHRMKSNFASSVSHELKTPLSSMRAFLEMLLDGDIEGEDQRRATLERVLDETERLALLIQNLLHLSRLEAGVTKVRRDRVDLVALLERLRDRMSPLALDRSQTLVFDVSEFLPPVTGDPALLEQALTNLVSNAIKYTPEEGSIRVTAALQGHEVTIAVEDTGVGIPKKALDLVFEKFTRVENHAGLEATGTGLGLPLAKFVAEIHGGGIGVASEEGVGSTFTLRIPVRRGEEEAGERLVGLEGISA